MTDDPTAWVEFYGGPWDGDMRRVPADDDGNPEPIIIRVGHIAGMYRSAGVISPHEPTYRMTWRHVTLNE